MRQNPHVRICGGPGSATTLVYPTGFDVMYWFTTSHRWFTCVRLSDPHLPSHARRFPNAHDRHAS